MSRPLCSPESGSCLVKMMLGCMLFVAAYGFYALIMLTLFPQPTQPGTAGCGLAALGRLFFFGIVMPICGIGAIVVFICVEALVENRCNDENETVDVEY